MIDVVRCGIYLCSKARHDEVEEFVHQDPGNGAGVFEKAPQDIKRIWRCDGLG
jgi:hypothetical protein